MFSFSSVHISRKIYVLSQYVNELVASRHGQLKITLVATHAILEDKSIVSRHRLVENIGVEPMTSCVQGRRSSQLS